MENFNKLFNQPKTGLLSPFTRRKSDKQTGFTFYNGIDTTIAAFKLNLTRSLKRLFFFLNKHPNLITHKLRKTKNLYQIAT
jgi:hypothetical protein